jgi:hypothetical protein
VARIAEETSVDFELPPNVEAFRREIRDFLARVVREGLSAALTWRDAPWQGTALWQYRQGDAGDKATQRGPSERSGL